MTIHGSALLTIVLMGVVTYLTRIGGYWLMGRTTISPRLESALNYLPGAVIVSLVVPGALDLGVPGIAGLLAVTLVMWRRPNLVLAMVVGIAVVTLVRRFYG